MFKCIIHIYGLPHKISDKRKVEVDLNEGAGMAEVVAALKRAIPSLEGPVIPPGEDRLEQGYKFNINGQFFFDGMDFHLKRDDRIALLMPVTGG